MNPFAQIPLAVCGDFDLPTIPVKQNCTNYDQRFSQIHSLAFLSPNGERPTDWTTANGWSNTVKNEEAWPTYGRYLVGIGSLLPIQPTKASLANGRWETYRERGYQLRFRVLNCADEHLGFAKRLENGFREFDLWALTIEDRLIGGEQGMRPVLVDVSYPYGEGQSREFIDLTFDLLFYQFPQVATLNVDWSNQSGFWGDITDNTIWGDPDGNTAWGFSN